MVGICLNLYIKKKTSKLSSKLAVPFFIPIGNEWLFLLFQCPHQCLLLSVLWILAILKGHVVVSFCCFNLQFPNEICTLAWKIPWIQKPGGLPSMGLHRVGLDWSNLAAAAAMTYVEHIFTCLLAIYVIMFSLVKLFVKFFWPFFKIQLFFFLAVEF